MYVCHIVSGRDEGYFVGSKILQNNALCMKPAQNGTSASAMIYYNTGFPEFGLITAPQYVPRSRWDMTPPPGEVGPTNFLRSCTLITLSCWLDCRHPSRKHSIKRVLVCGSRAHKDRISGPQRSDLGHTKIGLLNG